MQSKRLTTTCYTAVPGPPSKTPTEFGLTSEIGNRRATQSFTDLKLGPAPVDPRLTKEVARAIKDEGVSAAEKTAPSITINGAEASGATPAESAGDSALGTDADVKMNDMATATASKDGQPNLPELMSPFPAEMPPYPTALRTIDVMREVEKVREARKRIRLGAEAYTAPANDAVVPVPGQNKDKAAVAAKPSVCLFTVHDAGDRCACA